jgi:hypothetical protein
VVVLSGKRTEESPVHDVRVRRRTASPVAGERPGARESRLSRYLLWWLPAAPLIGFALAERVFNLGSGADWELWKAVVLGALMMTPFVVGAYFGLRSVRKGFQGGWVGLAVNSVLAVLAISMPVLEALDA